MLRLKRLKRGVWFSLLNDFKYNSASDWKCYISQGVDAARSSIRKKEEGNELGTRHN